MIAGGVVAGQARAAGALVTTWNPIDSEESLILSSGNLIATHDAGANRYQTARATRGIPNAGKGYFEIRLSALPSGAGYTLSSIGGPKSTLYACGAGPDQWGFYAATGQKINNNVLSSFGSAASLNDVIGFAYNNGSLWISVNGTFSGDPVAGTGAAFTGIGVDVFPMVSVYASCAAIAHFSAASLAYAPPTGYPALDDVTGLVDGIDQRVFATHFSGTDTGTDAVDEYGHTLAFNGSGAYLTTSVPKYGPTCLILGAATDTVTVDSSDFTPGAGDCYARGWVRIDANTGGYQEVFNTRLVGSAGFALYTDPSNQLALATNAAIISTGGSVIAASYHYVEATRIFGTWQLFVDGSTVGTPAADSRTLDLTRLNFGGSDGGLNQLSTNSKFEQWEFGLRIGHTANYTPPAGPFANPTKLSTAWSTIDQYNTTATGLTLVVDPKTTPSTTGAAAARTTNSRRPGATARQCNFKMTFDLVQLFGVADALADINWYPGHDSHSVGIYGSGGIYFGNSVLASTSALTLGAWYAMVWDFSGVFSVYDSTATLVGTASVGALAGEAMFLMGGNGSGGGSRILEIDPNLVQIASIGGALKWDA